MWSLINEPLGENVLSEDITNEYPMRRPTAVNACCNNVLIKSTVIISNIQLRTIAGALDHITFNIYRWIDDNHLLIRQGFYLSTTTNINEIIVLPRGLYIFELVSQRLNTISHELVHPSVENSDVLKIQGCSIGMIQPLMLYLPDTVGGIVSITFKHIIINGFRGFKQNQICTSQLSAGEWYFYPNGRELKIAYFDGINEYST